MLSKEELISLLGVQGKDVLQLMKEANSLRENNKITFLKMFSCL
jgi:FO synthase subunit 1